MATTPNFAPNFDQFATSAKEQIEKAATQFVKNYEAYTAFTKGNVDAVVQSSTVAVKGLEDLSKATIAYGQSSLESSVAASKAALGAKSLRELTELQTSFTKSSLETAVAETTKLSELSVKVTKDAIEPLTARVKVAVEQFSKPLAA
jgi:phasin family protein